MITYTFIMWTIGGTILTLPMTEVECKAAIAYVEISNNQSQHNAHTTRAFCVNRAGTLIARSYKK